MEKLNERKVPAMAFFHMPPAEFKEAYEKMKLGDRVIYEHGSIGERTSTSEYQTDHLIFEKRWITAG